MVPRARSRKLRVEGVPSPCEWNLGEGREGWLMPVLFGKAGGGDRYDKHEYCWLVWRGWTYGRIRHRCRCECHKGARHGRTY
jgi:hypothetical protein